MGRHHLIAQTALVIIGVMFIAIIGGAMLNY